MVCRGYALYGAYPRVRQNQLVKIVGFVANCRLRAVTTYITTELLYVRVYVYMLVRTWGVAHRNVRVGRFNRFK